jgi:hypothetical protein
MAGRHWRKNAKRVSGMTGYQARGAGVQAKQHSGRRPRRSPSEGQRPGNASGNANLPIGGIEKKAQKNANREIGVPGRWLPPPMNILDSLTPCHKTSCGNLPKIKIFFWKMGHSSSKILYTSAVCLKPARKALAPRFWHGSKVRVGGQRKRPARSRSRLPSGTCGQRSRPAGGTYGMPHSFEPMRAFVVRPSRLPWQARRPRHK